MVTLTLETAAMVMAEMDGVMYTLLTKQPQPRQQLVAAQAPTATASVLAVDEVPNQWEQLPHLHSRRLTMVTAVESAETEVDSLARLNHNQQLHPTDMGPSALLAMEVTSPQPDPSLTA